MKVYAPSHLRHIVKRGKFAALYVFGTSVRANRARPRGDLRLGHI